jgi:TonB family protein
MWRITAATVSVLIGLSLGAPACAPKPSPPESPALVESRNMMLARQYRQDVRQVVNPIWRTNLRALPATAAVVGDYTTSVDVVVNADGTVSSVSVVSSSGNATIDECATRAFAMARLPSLPEGANDGFTLRSMDFHLRVRHAPAAGAPGGDEPAVIPPSAPSQP